MCVICVYRVEGFSLYGLGTEILYPSELRTRILMGMLQLHVGVGGGGVQIPGELYPEAGGELDPTAPDSVIQAAANRLQHLPFEDLSQKLKDRITPHAYFLGRV